MGEAVPLGVVGAAEGDGGGEGDEVVGVHLGIARHHRDELGAARQRAAVARRDGRPDAAVQRVTDGLHPRVVAAGEVRGGVVGARVVNYDNTVDHRGHRRDHAEHTAPRVVRGDHDGELLSVEHRSRGGYPQGTRRRKALAPHGPVERAPNFTPHAASV